MDKKWQDIFYIDTSKPECLPDKYYIFAIRQVHINYIMFDEEKITIFYNDYNRYHIKVLKKERYHKLLIE